MTSEIAPAVALLLGQDHLEPDEYAMCAVGADWRTYASISVGGLQALHRKGGTEVPNEDCVFVADFGERAFHLVTDGHKGWMASHEIAERVADMVIDAASVYEPLRSLDWLTTQNSDLPWDVHSRTTLTLTAIDRERGVISGLAIGDSPVFHVSPSGGARELTEALPNYVTPYTRVPPSPVQVARFDAEPVTGDLILTCSDGITECHYGKPQTSVTPALIADLQIKAGGSLDLFAESLSELALDGVYGNPGGEDNLAFAVTRV